MDFFSRQPALGTCICRQPLVAICIIWSIFVCRLILWTIPTYGWGLKSTCSLWMSTVHSRSCIQSTEGKKYLAHTVNCYICTTLASFWNIVRFLGAQIRDPILINFMHLELYSFQKWCYAEVICYCFISSFP